MKKVTVTYDVYVDDDKVESFKRKMNEIRAELPMHGLMTYWNLRVYNDQEKEVKQ